MAVLATKQQKMDNIKQNVTRLTVVFLKVVILTTFSKTKKEQQMSTVDFIGLAQIGSPIAAELYEPESDRVMAVLMTQHAIQF